MKKGKGYIITVAITTLVCIAIFRGCGDQIVQYWEDPDFKTDTVIIRVPYDRVIEKLITDTFEYSVPPKIVYRYKALTNNGSRVECEDEYLLTVIDSLDRELQGINTSYLTNFPANPKLIYGLFRPDSIRLDLLYTDGEVYTEVYLTDYDRFKYQWAMGQFRAEELRVRDLPGGKESKRKLKSEVWVSPGYSLLDKKVTASADYYLRFKRYQANMQALTTIEQTPQLMINARLGFRLTK